MEKIINFSQIGCLVKQLKSQGKSIVLVGGCFDILHYGHIQFLEKAKKEGDILIIALESDKNVKKLKGKRRPIHSQKQRAKMLAALEFVDSVIRLPLMRNDQDYKALVKKIKPNIIAVTAGDPKIKKKKAQAKKVGGEMKIVSQHLKGLSTREIIKLIGTH